MVCCVLSNIAIYGVHAVCSFLVCVDKEGITHQSRTQFDAFHDDIVGCPISWSFMPHFITRKIVASATVSDNNGTVKPEPSYVFKGIDLVLMIGFF